MHFTVTENRHCKSKYCPFREKNRKKKRKETIAVMYFCFERDRLMSTMVKGWKRPVL